MCICKTFKPVDRSTKKTSKGTLRKPTRKAKTMGTAESKK
jgi:hypothetical protein